MDRSSLTRTYDTSQRNKYIALAAGVVVFMALWILVIVWLGQVGSAAPSDQASGQAPEQASGQAGPAAPATTAQEPADSEDTTADEPQGENEAGGEGGTDDSADTLGGGGEGSEEGGSQAAQSAGGGTQPSEVFDPLEEDSSTGETDEAAPESSDSGSQADLQTDPRTNPQSNPQTADYSPETDAAGGDDQAPEGSEDTENTEDEEQEEGTGQPVGAGTITDTDLARAKAASESYLTAAYGYTGTSAEDYLGGIEEAASEEVFGSPGGEKLEGYSEAAPECGMVSTVILDEFEVIGSGPDGLDALTTFSVEDADGQTHRFSQEHRLSFSEGVYQVAAVSVEELISDTTPRESCPGSANENPESPDDESVQSGEDSEETGEELDAGQKEQVRSAADRFITAAYGYTGDSENEYREAIERTTVSDRFFESPGGDRIDGYAKRVGEEGMEAAAKMERFELTGTSGEDIEGVAYFEVGSSYDRYANIEGEPIAYRQPLTLSPYEGSYRVSAAAAEEGIDDVRPTGDDDERKLTK
ncbi:hypothetical protein [Rubrobacter aplysinae]|uniref:hypothetical protein n=1 Tax=Rubrobacter aplysinae TaxID=909625 RepID=UPI00064BC3CF|nr:hypothetical protein [Rubrobacter aplysinae]